MIEDAVVVRTTRGIEAFDLRSGTPRWTFETAGSLHQLVERSLQESGEHQRLRTIEFESHWTQHGSQGRLTSDARHVYFIDDVPRPADVDSAHSRLSNRLIALPLLAQEDGDQQPVWIRDSSAVVTESTVAGSYFLGPPLALDGRLYALCEVDGQIVCECLQPHDGQTLWAQPIALVQQPVDWDADRQRMCCMPVYDDGVVICPTEVGLLVGIDAFTGTLLWAYDHLDEQQRQTSGRWSSHRQRKFGNTDIPTAMFCQQGRLYCLPFRSQSLHCLDSHTGARVWSVPRGEALVIQGVTPSCVLLSGSRSVCGLSPEDGTLLWQTNTPEIGGLGVVCGDRLLVTTIDGACLSIDVTNGQQHGSPFGRRLHELAGRSMNTSDDTGWPINRGGNLSTMAWGIVITGPTTVATYPQAGRRQSELVASNGEAPAPHDQLERAMLQLLLGQTTVAQSTLQSLLGQTTDDAIQFQAKELLCELLYVQLADSDAPHGLLTQLKSLVSTEEEIARLLCTQIDVALRLDDVTMLKEALEGLIHHENIGLIAPDVDGEYSVHPLRLASDQLAQARSNVGPHTSVALRRFLNNVIGPTEGNSEVDVHATTEIRSQQEWRSIITLFDDWPEVAALRNMVARADMEAGRLQRAELALLKNSESANGKSAREARELLEQLYGEHGFSIEAAQQRRALGRRAIDPSDRDISLVSHVMDDSLDSDELTIAQMSSLRRSNRFPIESVRIEESVCAEQCSQESCAAARAEVQHEQIRRKFIPVRPASMTVIDRGITTDDRTRSEIVLVNQDTGHSGGSVEIPAAYWQLASAGDGRVGQLLPVCGRAVHGLSLLERRALWTTADSSDVRQSGKIKLGPIGHDYCVLQRSRLLSVVHPATGEMLWQRVVPPGVGLMANDSSGLLCDDNTLTLFESDLRHYCVFETVSGRLLRKGQLPIQDRDVRRFRDGLGAKLVHIVSAEDGDFRFRVWDATHDRMLIDEPLREQLDCQLPGENRFALIRPDGQLLVADVSTGRIDVAVSVDDWLPDDPQDLRVVAGPQGYLVNVSGCDRAGHSRVAAAIDELEVGCMPVSGPLLAVSHEGGLLWQREVDDAALVIPQPSSPPLLTLVRRIRDGSLRSSASLSIEVLDDRTGKTVAQQDGLLRTRFVRWTHEPRDSRMTLIGLGSQVNIRWEQSEADSWRQPTPTHEPVTASR